MTAARTTRSASAGASAATLDGATSGHDAAAVTASREDVTARPRTVAGATAPPGAGSAPSTPPAQPAAPGGASAGAGSDGAGVRSARGSDAALLTNTRLTGLASWVAGAAESFARRLSVFLEVPASPA
ncbi:hypothetical protein GCM10025864_03560 [Luteimicrobium album]|uniref:Uncharacterized protein n=1 Tax=Luteimicrobium album TaxID=1054550 RepID=A0ABQ6HWS7_9MICO|nr:hypothetical protein [Luteimicrobium album]GMA22597.1 hypothetical protein GCM10025864_03560 [Luteimicrobium album]